MSRLLEIFGRAIVIDTADLMWHWLNAVNEAQPDTANIDRLNEIGDLMSRQKDDSAQEQLRLYLLDNPGCIYGRLAGAAICLAKCHLEEAIEQLNSVYTRQPNNTMALYALGHCYERLGKEAEAVEFYQDCLKFKNYLELPRQRLAAVYFKNGQLERTIQEYELLKDEYPDDMLTLVILGHLYIAAGGYDKAADTFNTAILIHPDNFHAPDEEINQLIDSGQADEALQQLDYLLEQEPERADLAVKRADVLGLLGSDADAVAQYQEALRLCPDFLEARIKLGTRYLRMTWGRLAAQQFNKAADINDQIVDAYIGLATAQKLAGQTAEAASTLSLAAAIQPNSSLLFGEAALLQFKGALGEDFHSDDTPSHSNDLLGAVIRSHEQQLQRRPDNPDLHYRLGVLLMGLDRPADAAKGFKAALHINPTFSRARTKLAVCLFETGKNTEALQQLTETPTLDTQTLELHYKTAILYCDKIRFASSLLNLQRYLQENFTHPDATVNVSIVLQNLGLLDRADTAWDNLMETTQEALRRGHQF